MLKFLLEKEFKQILRNTFLPKLIILMPVMMLLFLPWAADLEVKNINISIVDNDKSTYSERLIQKILSSDYFVLKNVSSSYTEAMESVELGESDIILEIRPDFEKELVKNGITDVMIAANAVNGTKGSIGSTYLMSIMTDFSDNLREEWGLKAGEAMEASINIVPYYKFNTFLDYKFFMIPAMITMLLTLISGFLPAFNIVSEKEVGTIEQMNVSPVGRLVFILSKLIPYWLIGFIVITIGFIIASLLYGMVPVGSFLTIYFYAGVYILSISGLGLIISNSSETLQQAMFLMFFFILVMIMLSGLFTPVSSMPEWAQWIARANPLTYYMEVLRAVYLKGSSTVDLLPQLFALLGFAAVLNVWAVVSYRKSN